MKLSEYLKTKSITAAEFARQIGAKSRATVHRYTDEFSCRVPHPEMMRKIFEVTGGAVSPSDFYNIPTTTSKRKVKEKSA
jgi:hypothetical protein